MPPTTPRELFSKLQRKPTIGMRIAGGWVLVGSLVALFAAVFVIAHFGFHVPVQNNDTGRPATSGEVLFVSLLLMGGGLFFVAAGLALRRWLRSQLDGS